MEVYMDFYVEDSWHVDVAKLSALIKKILEKAGDDQVEAELIIHSIRRVLE